MTTTPLSIRLFSEFKEIYRREAEKSGMKQEEFLQTLLETYKTSNDDECLEKKQIRVKADQIVKLACGVIDRALDQENTALESVTQIQKECSDQISEQKQEIVGLKQKIEILEKENRQLLEKQENVASWKDLLKEKDKLHQEAENESKSHREAVQELKKINKKIEMELKDLEINLRKQFEEKLENTFRSTLAEINKMN